MWNNFFKQPRHLPQAVSFVLILSLLLLSPGWVTYAQTTNDEVTEVQPEALIETGNAAAASDTINVSNLNQVDTDSASSSPSEAAPDDEDDPTATSTESEDKSDNATSTPEVDDETVVGTSTATTSLPLLAADSATTSNASGTSTDDGTIIEIDNAATTTNHSTTSASTGHNTADGGDEDSAIITGDAYAYANVVNLTNTNIINSTGFITFLNQIFGVGTVDVRDMFDVFSGGATTNPCTHDGCEAQQLEYYLANQSTTTNNISVSANTGGNTASGSAAAILTGDAYAAANVTNITNTNIIDANYLVLSFSNFGDLLGDIVLPGKDLLQKLFGYTTGASAPLTFEADNQADITNNINTSANTGNNAASSSGSGSGTVLTGNATTYSSVYNQTNTTAINGDSFVMLFRIHGDWDGQVYGLPDGLHWEETPGGIAISNSTSESTAPFRGVTAEIANAAQIENNVSVSADTGFNQTTSDRLSYIETGDAYAASNITNIANTNILGRNWSLLIFDIFGNWNGSLSFGQPDLWIGGTANATNGATAAGAEVLYTFTVSNLGDTAATNVVLNGEMNSDLIQLTSPLQNISLGTIEPGETIERTYAARVTSSLPNGSFPVDLIAQVSGVGPDENDDNNEEIITVIAENHSRSGSGGGSGIRANDITRNGNLKIEKTANLTTILPGDTVEYEINVTSTGGPIFNGILYDTLYDENGNVILDQNWPLQKIEGGETITVTYEIEFSTSTNPGVYTNSAQVLGYHKNQRARFMREYDSAIASVPINISGSQPAPLVLGAVTNCGPYLTSYLRPGTSNDSTQVERLQRFLKGHIDSTLVPSGYFGPATETAVRRFQEQYRASVLTPWGLESPTGYVYYTTQKMINEISCAYNTTFPLSTNQITEMAQYRNTTVEPRREQVAATPSAPEAPLPTVAIVPTVQAAPKRLTQPIANNLPNLDLFKQPNISSTQPSINPDEQTPNVLKRLMGWLQRPTLDNLKFW